jgi:hypothetical protein
VLEHTLSELKSIGPLDQATLTKILTSSIRILQTPPQTLISKLNEMAVLFDSDPSTVLKIGASVHDVLWMPPERLRDRYVTM